MHCDLKFLVKVLNNNYSVNLKSNMYDRNVFKNNSYDKTTIFSNANKYLNFKTQKSGHRSDL